MKQIHKRVKTMMRQRRHLAAGVIGVFIVIGVVASLILLRAATPYLALDAENGTVTAPAAKTADSTAAGGSAVKFGAAAGTGSWWSGQSDNKTTADGSFAAWRGRSIEIGGAWANTDTVANSIAAPNWSFSPGNAYANTPRMDWASGAFINNSGENWAAAAAGAYDSRYTQQIQALKAAWGSRPAGNFYIRYAHEFNGNWFPWKVDTSNVSNFVNAFKRYHGLVKQHFPGAQVVWCPNGGSSYAYDIRTLYPGDAYVDVISIDLYNNYPFATTKAEFDAKANAVSPQGGPVGYEAWRKFAESRGKPMAISEWSNPGVAGAGGGGESPGFMQYFHEWLTANGSQTPMGGKVLYEVVFNVTGYADHYSLFPIAAETGNTTTAAKYAELW